MTRGQGRLMRKRVTNNTRLNDCSSFMLFVRGFAAWAVLCPGPRSPVAPIMDRRPARSLRRARFLSFPNRGSCRGASPASAVTEGFPRSSR